MVSTHASLPTDKREFRLCVFACYVYRFLTFSFFDSGSGKTYTMEGVESNNQRGISYRTIQKIFHLLSLKAQQEKTAAILFKTREEREEEKEGQFVFQIQIGMLEIYNDECYDLLGGTGLSLAEKKAEAQKAGGKASLEIRRNKEGNHRQV